jgi:hypothetical protein
MKIRTLACTVFLALAMGATGTAQADSSLPGDELLPLLYETFDGDNWHHNDDWLDDEVHWCDWHGITCSVDHASGAFSLDALALPGNNLSGEWNEELAWLLLEQLPPRTWLDLANNDIGGSLHRFPAHTRFVDLSGNRLAGQLPAADPDIEPVENQHLLLARDDFEGDVPDSWQELHFRWLDLADNRLEGGHLIAFRALSRTPNGFLDLAGNHFSGELTSDIQVANLNRNDGPGNAGGGLNICFNDLVPADEDIAQWIAQRHAGGPEFEQCLGRERSDMAADISGSWFNPEFDGEGVILHLLDTGTPLLYSFSFDRLGRQQWLFEVGHPAPQSFLWERLKETRGDFGQGMRHDGDQPMMRGMSRMRFDRLDDHHLHLERNYYDLASCGPFMPIDPDEPAPPGFCTPELFSDRLDYHRLTEMAGTTCDNQSDFQQYSGAWFNPDTDGEGFIIEVLPDDRAVVYWFTYAADDSGEQAWMMGDGDMVHGGIILPGGPEPSPGPSSMPNVPLRLPVGATYGPDFDPDDIDMIDWGTITIVFDESDSAHVQFESNLEDFGSGDFPIERLARPKLAECD